MPYKTSDEVLSAAGQKGHRRVLIATAVALEMKAVLAHLTDVVSVKGSNGEIYECGTFSDPTQDWFVVVVETGMGTHNAQREVSDAHFTFPGFELQFMIGSAGSRKADDAPLGAVVAADLVYLPYASKFSDGNRSSRPRPIYLTETLVKVARKVARDDQWQARIRDTAGAFVSAPVDYKVVYPPIGIVAPIVSVEGVLADPKSNLATIIAEDCGDACALEIEGYGAAAAAERERVSNIIVRGISDLTEHKDPLKDRELQPIAARHAIAFALEVMTQWAQLYPAPQPGQGRLLAIADRQALLNISATSVTTGAFVAQTSAFVAESVATDKVLNFSEPFTGHIEERLIAIESTLREIVNSNAITVTKGAKGSLRVFVSDPLNLLGQLGVSALRDELATRDAGDLIGMVTLPEFEQLESTRNELLRASQELLKWRATLPSGEQIDRPEFLKVIERIDGSKTSVTALLGVPGAGKSALLSNLARHYSNRGWPVMALKADLIGTDVRSEDDLCEQLGLKARPSDVIRRFANFQPTLLILDQLDALAGYLDLKTGRLSTFLSLVRKLGDRDNVHIVLSCRTFEYNHDVRLKSISADAIALELPPWSEVLSLLQAHGINAAGWPLDAKEVMRSPQALATYLSLDQSKHSQAFASYQLMLDALWEERLLGSSFGMSLTETAKFIAEEMATDESLWVARSRFDTRADEVFALEAAGVLIEVDGSIGFSHQTLFEYALARSFTGSRGKLSTYVLERQYSLFLRPKLWAGLTYLRGVDQAAYLFEINAIWHAQGLQKHLRFLLIEFLGQQAEPLDREALLMEAALSTQGERWIAFRALTGSKGWFARFSRTFIAAAMEEGGDAAIQMITVLNGALEFDTDQVVALLRDYWLASPDNDLRVWSVLQHVQVWSDATLEIAKTIVKRTDISQFAIDHLISSLGVQQPETAISVVRAQLDRQLAVALAAAEERLKNASPWPSDLADQMSWLDQHNPDKPLLEITKGRQDWDHLVALAEANSVSFAAAIAPWFQAYLDALLKYSRNQETGAAYNRLWEVDFKFDDDHFDDTYDRESAILGAIKLCVQTLAQDHPDIWREWAVQLSAIEALPAQNLVAFGYSSSPEVFCEEGLEFIRSDPRRYLLGSYRDTFSTTVRLVSALSPFWTAEALAAFEKEVKTYRPTFPPTADPKERRRQNRTRRRTILAILRALPRERVSASTARHVEEEQRVFPHPAIGIGREGGGFIGSIMDANAISKASDDDVVNAFVILPDSSEWSHPRDWTAGGNIQLSREFASFAKQNPERAERIISKLTPENGTRAGGYVVEAVAETWEAEKTFDLIRDLVKRGFDGEEFRQSICRGLDKMIGEAIAFPDDLITIVERWLNTPLKPPESLSDEAATVELIDAASIAGKGKNESDVVQRSLMWGYGGLSALPSGDYPLLETLVRIFLDRKDSAKLEVILGHYLDRNTRVLVWENLLRFIPYIPETDVKTRLVTRIFNEIPNLVGLRNAAALLTHAAWWIPNLVDLNLDPWRDSTSPEVRQAYGEMIGILAIAKPDLEWAQGRLQEITTVAAYDDARAGAALSAAHMWSDTKSHARAGDLLNRLLGIGGEGVWKAGFDLFRVTDELGLDEQTAQLLTILAERVDEAPVVDSTFVVDRLAALLPHQASLVGRAADALVSKWAGDLANVQTGTAASAPELVDLAVTLHRLGPETREIGTRIFERLIEIDAWSARETLDEIDNRFRDRAPSTRPRLPRRSRRARQNRAEKRERR